METVRYNLRRITAYLIGITSGLELLQAVVDCSLSTVLILNTGVDLLSSSILVNPLELPCIVCIYWKCSHVTHKNDTIFSNKTWTMIYSMLHALIQDSVNTMLSGHQNSCCQLYISEHSVIFWQHSLCVYHKCKIMIRITAVESYSIRTQLHSFATNTQGAYGEQYRHDARALNNKYY